MKKMLVVGSLSYGTPFLDKYSYMNDKYLPELPHKLKEKPDLVVFTGGEDINPSMYGEEDLTIYGSHYNDARDKYEKLWWLYAKANSIPMVGICRGMQLFTIMHGGKLIQHIEGHAVRGSHAISTIDKQHILVNSLHHQVCIPYDFKNKKFRGEVLAWSNTGSGWRCSQQVEEKFVELGCIPEAIWWKESKCLGVQFHPEMMGKSVLGYEYFKSIFDKHIG